jgi:hypothetical protein
LRRYLSEGSIPCYLNRHYPVLVAHTGSWARPKPSPLPSVVPIAVGLCRLLPVPAGRWSFPTLSLQSLHGCLDPYPAASLRCTYPFLPGGLRPRSTQHKLGTPVIPAMQLQQGTIIGAAVIPSCSSSHARQAPRLHPPLWLYIHRAAGPFTPRNGHAVTRHELWYRYMPETGN